MNIKIQAKLAELNNMREQLIAFAKNNFVAKGIANLIVLSVDEICTNLIKYAYKYDDAKSIDIFVEIADNKFITIIKDNSPPFDIRKHIRKNIVEHIQNLNIGGLGMHIVVTAMDEIYYEAIDSSHSHNTLTLIKKLS